MCPKMEDKRDEGSEASHFSPKVPLEGGAFKTPKTHENFYFFKVFLFLFVFRSCASYTEPWFVPIWRCLL